MFFKTLAPFLFWAPYVYHQGLKVAWVDGLLYGSIWQRVVEGLREDGKELILLVCLSTLL